MPLTRILLVDDSAIMRSMVRRLWDPSYPRGKSMQARAAAESGFSWLRSNHRGRDLGKSKRRRFSFFGFVIPFLTFLVRSGVMSFFRREGSSRCARMFNL